MTSAPGAPGPDPASEYRSVRLALRVGAAQLASGASSDDVERSMRRIGIRAGLSDVQSVVMMGILSMSALRRADQRPITQMRIVGARRIDYHRLAQVASLVDRVADGTLAIGAAGDELGRIERLPAPYPPVVGTVAIALSAAASTILFGGGILDALVTTVIGLAVDPVVRRVERSGLPDFFQALFGPLIATVLAVAAVAAGLPIAGGLVISGSILRFLPGAALVAGMRDLVDRSIISGSARLAEAMLLGAGVAMGVAVAIGASAAVGGPSLNPEALSESGMGSVAQAVAAGIACGAFALHLGVAPRRLPTVSVLGGLAWSTWLVVGRMASDPLVPVVTAAVLVGVVGQALASRARLPSVIWTVPAILPLLPGLGIVLGIGEIMTLGGMLTVASAVGTGFGLGIGVAFGSILVSTSQRLVPVPAAGGEPGPGRG